MKEFHEAAEIFPLDEENLAELAEDIRKNGQQVPIELFGGKIIDGRRRYKACGIAGVQPKFRDVTPTDPIAYVVSLNIHRRHLTVSQRAMVAGRVREIYDRDAKDRQAEAAKRGNKSRAGKDSPVVANWPQPGTSRDAAGSTVGVGGRTVDRATKVLNNAVPEVIKAVDQGHMSVNAAAEIADLPEEEQREEAAKPKAKAPAPKPEPEPEPEPEYGTETGRKTLGKGIHLAHEAINSLIRIPKNDALRSQGFKLVTDWIKRNP